MKLPFGHPVIDWTKEQTVWVDCALKLGLMPLYRQKLPLVHLVHYKFPMDIIDVHDAQTHLSRLLDDVARGKEMMLAKNGKPIARLSPLKPTKRVLPYGLLKGKLKLRAGFDDPLPDNVVAGFLGG